MGFSDGIEGKTIKKFQVNGMAGRMAIALAGLNDPLP